MWFQLAERRATTSTSFQTPHDNCFTWSIAVGKQRRTVVHVSLIGVFVTVSGIVVGSDTALRERGTSDFTVASGPKFITCGPSAYAGVTGITRWIVNDGTATNAYDAIDEVKETCEA